MRPFYMPWTISVESGERCIEGALLSIVVSASYCIETWVPVWYSSNLSLLLSSLDYFWISLHFGTFPTPERRIGHGPGRR